MLPHTRNSTVMKITFSSAVIVFILTFVYVDHKFTNDFIYCIVENFSGGKLWRTVVEFAKV